MAVLFKDVVDLQSNDARPLHRATLDDSIDTLNELIEAGANLNARDRNDATPLHWAAAANSSQSVERLIEAGASPNSRSHDNWTPLHWGSVYGATESIDRLLQTGADPNTRGDQGETPLHVAASSKSSEILERLLQAGADPKARDRNGETALHRSAHEDDPRSVEILWDAGFDLHVRDMQGETALHHAVRGRSEKSVELLLRAGAVPDSRDAYGRTALHKAATLNAPGVADHLLLEGADPSARDKRGVTPLHCAASAWAPDTVDRLLEAGADPQAQDKDQGLTPLHHAIDDRNRIDVVDRLLEAGADPNTRDIEDSTLLHDAARYGSPEMVERLLQAGADPHARDNQGRTALHWASGLDAQVDWDSDRTHEFKTEDRVASIDHLIKVGSPINARDDQGRIALHEAAALGSPEVADRLINAGAVVNARDDNGRSALHEAALHSSPETAQRLLDAGAIVNARDEKGMTALEYGTERMPGADEFREVIEQHQARQRQVQQQEPPPGAKHKEKEPPREPSPEKPEPPAMAHRAGDVNAVDEYGNTALHRAAEHGSVTRIHQLLNAGANLESRDEQGATPLIVAVRNGETEAVKRLLEAGPNLAARDSIGNTPLHYAAGAGNPDLTNRLLQAGADPHARNNDDATPVHAVTAHPTHIEPGSGSIETVDRLAKAGADLNAQDKAGNTALHFLAEGRKPDASRLAESLLERGARLDLVNAEGRTAPESAAADRGGVHAAYARVVKEAFDHHQTRHQAGPPQLDQQQPDHAGAAQRKSEEALEIEHLRKAGIRCEPGARGGWDCIEVSQNEFLGNYETPAKAAKEMIGNSFARREQELSHQRGQQQLEQAAPAPQKRRWWRRSKSTPREGAGDKAGKSSRPSAQEYAKQASEKVIKQLEKGVAPWQKPWSTPSGANEPPHNPVSKTRYKGLNAIVLRAESEERGYSDPRWVTYKQAKELGANVRKGERGTRIEYWKFTSPEQGKDKGEGSPAEDGRQLQERPILHRTYTVFNAEQIDRMPEREHSQTQQWEGSERADQLIKESGADIVHVHGDRAFYRPGDDKIVLPKREQFPTHEAYYSTAIHEMGHWTGHKDRLDRETLKEAVKPETGGYGSEAYAKEELRAEMTSMTVNGVMKLPHDPERHASYVNSWIKALKDDPNELRHAARDAGAAAEYLLKYDRERPRDIEPPSRQADYSSPMPERPLDRTKEPQLQAAQEQEMSLSR